MKPKKLIREKIISKLKDGEFENITDLKELNKLYALKIREELAEIQESEHKDIMEFVDLIQVAWCWAEQNGFTYEQVELSANIKFVEKGKFSNVVLNNLNPDNPSNKLYFENDK
jgi:predicted house-cleaning noncanonical NTP pyrophosphatase (MazG superfamily)